MLAVSSETASEIVWMSSFRNSRLQDFRPHHAEDETSGTLKAQGFYPLLFRRDPRPSTYLRMPSFEMTIL
jgi:hypothetical protein